MIEHRLLEEVLDSAIETSAFSDHSPVSLQIILPGESCGRGTWRINEELLEDREIEKTITDEIENYFQENDTPDLPRATLWEAHKPVIRGKLISIGASRKKERHKNMLKLQNEIYDLEQRHKKEAQTEIHRSLTLKREQLKDLLEREDRKEINRVLSELFMMGNKAGKHLANILRRKRTLKYIEKKK